MGTVLLFQQPAGEGGSAASGKTSFKRQPCDAILIPVLVSDTEQMVVAADEDHSVDDCG